MNTTTNLDYYCATDMAFCKLKALTNNYYFGDFDGVFGLGLNTSEEYGNNFVMMWAEQSGNAAKATIHYDFEGDSSWIYFGDTNDQSDDTILGYYRVPDTEKSWSLKVENLTYGTT